MQSNNTNNAMFENHDDGTYVVKKTKKTSIFAFIICVLVAFVIWAYVEATEAKVKEKNLPDDTSVACAELDAESMLI